MRNERAERRTSPTKSQFFTGNGSTYTGEMTMQPKFLPSSYCTSLMGSVTTECEVFRAEMAAFRRDSLENMSNNTTAVLFASGTKYDTGR